MKRRPAHQQTPSPGGSEGRDPSEAGIRFDDMRVKTEGKPKGFLAFRKRRTEIAVAVLGVCAKPPKGLIDKADGFVDDPSGA